MGRPRDRGAGRAQRFLLLRVLAHDRVLTPRPSEVIRPAFCRDASMLPAVDDGIEIGEDGRPRCSWGASTPDYVAYHDTRVGLPGHRRPAAVREDVPRGVPVGPVVADDPAQARGLPRGVRRLRRRPRRRFGDDDVDRLLGDAGIVRHGGKIRSTINNARARARHGRRVRLARRVRVAFEPPRRPAAAATVDGARRPDDARVGRDGEGPEAARLSFVGPTTVYAFMQAMGLVNDHLEGCCVREPAEAARVELNRPVRSRS